MARSKGVYIQHDTSSVRNIRYLKRTIWFMIFFYVPILRNNTSYFKKIGMYPSALHTLLHSWYVYSCRKRLSEDVPCLLWNLYIRSLESKAFWGQPVGTFSEDLHVFPPGYKVWPPVNNFGITLICGYTMHVPATNGPKLFRPEIAAYFILLALRSSNMFVTGLRRLLALRACGEKKKI